MKGTSSKWAFALAATLASGIAIAGSEQSSGAMNFKALDENGDGYISKSEATASPALAKHWSKADADGNGRLDQAEFAKIETSGGSEDE